MTKISIGLVSLLLTLASACQNNNSKTDRIALTRIPDNTPTGPTFPVVGSEFNGQLTLGGIVWTLPTFLQGKFQNYEYSSVASFPLDLVNSGPKRASYIRNEFEVRWCYPEIEAEFVNRISSVSGENVQSKDKNDVHEIRTWTSETEKFAGRMLFAKRYNSKGDKIYRLDALIANEKLSQCVLWKFTFMPIHVMDAEFIEGTDEYRALIESIASTWGDLGASLQE